MLNWQYFENQFLAHLKPTIEKTQELILQMEKEGGGKITFILDLNLERNIEYVTTQYALLGFSKAVAKEVKRLGIEIIIIKKN